MKKCGIYKIQNNVNNKVYIGQSISIYDRWDAHKRTAYYENSEEYNYPLYCAIRKYGIENFSFIIEEECLPEELNEKEIYYIEYYNSYRDGYNQTPGGDKPPFSGIGTCQWDLNGNLIKKWVSGNAAANALGVTRTSIYEVIKGQRPTCCNCLWTRDDGTQPIIPTSNIVCPIRQYDLNGNFIAEYKSATEAEQTLLNDTSRHGQSVMRACNGETKTALGFQWRRAHDDAPIKIQKAVLQYDLEGNLIKRWPSINAAAKELGFSQGNIWSVCNERRKTAHGYKWKYE